MSKKYKYETLGREPKLEKEKPQSKTIKIKIKDGQTIEIEGEIISN